MKRLHHYLMEWYEDIVNIDAQMNTFETVYPRCKLFSLLLTVLPADIQQQAAFCLHS